MKDVDLVITGGGSLDRQTLEGKTPAGVARLARKLGKPVFAIVGRATEDREVREIFDGVYENARRGMNQEENMRRAAELLRENARALACGLWWWSITAKRMGGLLFFEGSSALTHPRYSFSKVRGTALLFRRNSTPSGRCLFVRRR